jgi:hypothetical protein
MKMKKLGVLLLTTLALCACSSGGDGVGDEPGVPNPPTGDKRLPISIGMTVNDRENTRVTDLAFEAGDQIGLFVVNRNADGTAQALKTTGNHVNNMRFTYSGTWTPDAPIYWTDDKTHADFYMYYPYKATVTDVTAMPFSVNADQSTDAAYKAGDVIIGSRTNVAPTEAAVMINARHAMSQMLITLVPGNGFTEESLAAAEVSVRVNGVKTNATIDLATATVTAVGDISAVTPLKTGDAYKALIVPQTVDEGNLLIVTVDGREYNLVRRLTFESGKRYNCTVELSKTSEGVNVTIGDWEDDGTDYGGTAE